MGPDPEARRSRRRKRWLLWAALALPLVAALGFVRLYATAMPLTDEWTFVKSVMNLRDIHLSDPGWFDGALRAGTWRFNGHCVVVPFLLYWLLAPITHFDTRVFIAITLATFALQVALYHRYFRRSIAATIPIAVLLFCPSHYMEFLWGFEFTLALSIVLPMAGLAVVDRIAPRDPWTRKCARLGAAMLLVLLGTLSSLGGIFGFACVALLIALKPLGRRTKLALLAPPILVGAGLYSWLTHGLGHPAAFGVHEMFLVLTAIGGTIWGTRVGSFEFGLDLQSATGAVILACLIAAVVRAGRIGRLQHIALPLGFAAFGLLSMTAIAVGRGYLGNWHLQYALPTVCGAFACTFVVWRRDGGSACSIVPFATLSAIVVLSLAGYSRAFSDYGPSYHTYVRAIESYAVRFLEEPDLPKPFPEDVSLDPEIVLYLRALHHPLFGDAAAPTVTAEASGELRVFIGVDELRPPYRVTGPAGRRLRFVVALPSSSPVRGVLVRAGEAPVVLHRIHPRHVNIPACADATCFAGIMLPGKLGKGVQPVTVWFTE